MYQCKINSIKCMVNRYIYDSFMIIFYHFPLFFNNYDDNIILFRISPFFDDSSAN